MIKITVCNTSQVIKLAKDSKGRNRSIDPEFLKEQLNPDGIHLVVFQMVHNDVELRTMFYLCVNDSSEPVEQLIDHSFEVWENNHTIMEKAVAE